MTFQEITLVGTDIDTRGDFVETAEARSTAPWALSIGCSSGRCRTTRQRSPEYSRARTAPKLILNP